MVVALGPLPFPIAKVEVQNKVLEGMYMQIT